MNATDDQQPPGNTNIFTGDPSSGTDTNRGISEEKPASRFQPPIVIDMGKTESTEMPPVSANEKKSAPAPADKTEEQPPVAPPPEPETPASPPEAPNPPPPPWLTEAPATGEAPPPPANEPPPASSGEKPKNSLAVVKSLTRFIPWLIGLAVLVALFLIIFRVVVPMVSRRSGSGQGASKKTVNLIYWGLWESNEALASVFADYEQSHPGIKISYQQSSSKDYRVRLQSALASKKTDQASGPDIFRFHNTWLPMLQGSLAPIETKNISLDDYFPAVKKDLIKGNSLYGLPLMFDCLSLYYNREIFTNANKQVPLTWDELRTVASELTVYDENGRIQTAGAALGTAGNVDHFSDILGLMMLQNSVDLTKPDDCFKSDNEETCLGRDALTFYTLFTTQDKVWDETLPSSTYAFAIGKAAMMIAPSWRAFDVQSINPNLKFQTAPVPQIPTKDQVSWATYWAEGVAQASVHTKEATELLTYLSQDDVLRKLYSEQSKLRLFGELYPKASLVDVLKSDPVIGSFVAQAPYAQSWYMASFTHDDGLNDNIIQYYENAVNAIVQGEDASSALATAGQGIKQTLSTYQVAAN